LLEPPACAGDSPQRGNDVVGVRSWPPAAFDLVVDVAALYPGLPGLADNLFCHLKNGGDARRLALRRALYLVLGRGRRSDAGEAIDHPFRDDQFLVFLGEGEILSLQLRDQHIVRLALLCNCLPSLGDVGLGNFVHWANLMIQVWGVKPYKVNPTICVHWPTMTIDVMVPKT